MDKVERVKVEWQKHNRDNDLSWNEVAELVNRVVDATLEDFEEYLMTAEFDVWWMEGAATQFKNRRHEITRQSNSNSSGL